MLCRLEFSYLGLFLGATFAQVKCGLSTTNRPT